MIPFQTVRLTLELSQPIHYDLNDYSTCVVTRYVPAIRRRSFSPLGESGVYETGVEEITVTLYGDTLASVLGRLERLNRFLEFAALWRTNNSSKYFPVKLSVLPADDFNGQTLPYDCYVYVPPDFVPLQVDPSFNSDLNRWEIRDVTISLYSCSIWLGSETDVVTVSARNGREQLITMPAWPVNMSVSSALDANDTTAMPHEMDNYLTGRTDMPNGLLAIGQASFVRVLTPAATGAGTTDWTAVADSGRFPTHTGNNVLRITPTAANTWRPTNAITPSLANLGTQLNWMKVRSNSTARVWQIRIRFTAGNNVYYSSTVRFQATSTVPTIIQFEPITLPTGVTSTIIEVQCDGTGQTLDFDGWLAVTDIDRPDVSRVIGVQAWNQPTIAGDQRFFVPYQFLRADPILAIASADTPQGYVGYTGDPNLELSGISFRAAFFAVHGNLDFWTLVNTAAGAALTHEINIRRRNGYLLPM